MEIDATQHPDVAPVIVESQMSQEIGMTDATEMPEHHPSAGTAAPIRGWKGSFSSAASQTEILIPLSGAPKIAEIGEDTQAYCDEPMNGEPLCQQRVGNVLDALLDDDCEATQAYREFPDEKEAEKGSQQEDLGTAVAESSSGFQCGQPSTECVAAAHADGSSEATRPHDAQIALGQNNGVNNPEESFLDGSAPDDASQDTQVDLDEPERMNDFESVEESRPAGDEHDTSDDVQKTQVYNEFPDEKDAEEESQQEDLGTAVPESSGGFQCGDPSAECVAESQDVELPRVVLDMFSGQSTESGEVSADGDFAYIEEPLPDVADLAVSMVHVIDLRRGQPLRYQAESQPFPGCTSSEAAPATGSPQPADVICASQARDEAMAPRVQSPRLSLLLPKRARRRVKTPGSYEAASEALWGGRTPGRAKRFPSLRELLAAREEESDEPLLKSGVAHVSPFKKSYLEDSPGQRMKEELWSRRRQSIRRWSRSALSARRRSSLRRSRSPVTPWQGKSEMRSAYREASPAPSAPCSPPVARMLNFETPSWLQQVQDLRPFSPGCWPAAAAASPEGKQSNGMACMPDIPTPCRTKRSLGGNDGIASDTDGAASPASPASPGASVAPTESEAPTTATTKPASPLVAAMTEAAAAPHAALPESQRSDSVDPLAAPVDTDSQGGQGRDQGMKVSQASQDACRMQRNLSGNDGIASDADGAASPASPGASVATTEPASPPEVAAMTEAAAAPHAALPESQRSDSVDPLAAPVDTDSQGGQGRGQGMKVSQASQVESVQPEVSHAESPGQNLSADASVASFQEGSNQTGAELPQFFAQMTQEDVPLRVPIEEVCSRPVEPAEPEPAEPAEPEFHGSEPKAPVKAKRTAAKSRPRIPSSTTSWQRPLPAELGGPAALDPVATPETLAPEVRTKNRPRGKRPATSVDAAATTVCSAPTEQNTTEVPEPPRQRSTRPLCDDDSEATSKKRKRPATAATATAAKSKATKVDKATRVKTLPPPQSVAKECKLAGDAYISTPAEAAVAAAVGRKVFATTGVELSGRQKRFLMDLQGVLVSDWIPQISHVIADTFRRTTKMMCAICTGARIVTPNYVKACREAGRWVDEEDFTLKDEICESAFARKRGMPGYSLAAAVKRAQSNGPLLQGISVYVFPSVGDKRDLPILVAAAGGMWLKRFPLQPEDPSVLLLAERSVNSERERKRRKTFEVYDVELLREAACTQELRKSAYRLQ